MTIDFGKHKGHQISECDSKYLSWLVSHEKVLALRNRWSSRDARFELQRRAAALAAQTAEAEMAVKVAEEIIKESAMLKAIRVVAKGYGFDWQGSLVKTLVANEKASFTATEMYEALESVSEGEDMDSPARVEEYLKNLASSRGMVPVRLEKVGEYYQVKYIDRTWSECK